MQVGFTHCMGSGYLQTKTKVERCFFTMSVLCQDLGPYASCEGVVSLKPGDRLNKRKTWQSTQHEEDNDSARDLLSIRADRLRIQETFHLVPRTAEIGDWFPPYPPNRIAQTHGRMSIVTIHSRLCFRYLRLRIWFFFSRCCSLVYFL